MTLQIPTVAFDILDVATECKSSCRLAKQCLVLLQRISSYSVQYKNELYHMGAHRACIRCVSAFPSQPSVLASSLGLLASIISKDGVCRHPKCSSSNGDMDFGSLSDGEIYSSFWRSEDRQPSLANPHWIDIDVSSFDKYVIIIIIIIISAMSDCVLLLPLFLVQLERSVVAAT
jgi:hypothetical protein